MRLSFLCVRCVGAKTNVCWSCDSTTSTFMDASTTSSVASFALACLFLARQCCCSLLWPVCFGHKPLNLRLALPAHPAQHLLLPAAGCGPAGWRQTGPLAPVLVLLVLLLVARLRPGAPGAVRLLGLPRQAPLPPRRAAGSGCPHRRSRWACSAWLAPSFVLVSFRRAAVCAIGKQKSKTERPACPRSHGDTSHRRRERRH